MRVADGYHDSGTSLPSNLSSAHHHTSVNSSMGSRPNPQISSEGLEQGARGNAQRKRRTHTSDSRKTSPVVQQVYDLVDKATEQLSSLEAQRKEVRVKCIAPRWSVLWSTVFIENERNRKWQCGCAL